MTATIIIAVVTLILAIPVAWIGNLTTPLFAKWLVTRSKTSLDKRIVKLDAELAELEKSPEIDELQDEILWAIKGAKITMIAVGNGIVITIYFGVTAVANPNSFDYKMFGGFVLLMIIYSFVDVLRLRYQRDFRWQRSPRYRRSLKKSIAELKEMQKNWGTQSTH